MKHHNKTGGSGFEGDQGQPEKSSSVPNNYNDDLAHKVAEDARKLIKNQISEEEFYRKHNKAYIDEFGIDNRPVDKNNDSGKLSISSALGKNVSRRTLLKAGGTALASAAGLYLLGGKAFGAQPDRSASYGKTPLSAGEEEPEETGRVQKGLVIDLEKCDGCMECVYACKHHNSLAKGVFWLYVLAFKDLNRDDPNFLVRLCQNCGNPPCVKVCPVRARHKREIDGLVLTDYNLCIGCRYCMVACPYGVNYFQWDDPPPRNGAIHKYTDYRGRWVVGNPPKGVMGKCDYCPERQDDGRNNLVCELSCPHDVLHFGDMNDPNSRPNQYLAQRQQASGGRLSTFRLLENLGTKPSIIYIGQQPSETAKQVDGPVTYADWGFVEKRMELLGGHEPWFIETFGGGQ